MLIFLFWMTVAHVCFGFSKPRVSHSTGNFTNTNTATASEKS